MSETTIRAVDLGKQYQIGSLRTSFRPGQKEQPFWKRWMSRTSGNKSECFWALQDVSFEVQHGDVVGLIGGNGAGKSTLLKILSRITDPTCGRAELQGRIGSLLEVGTGFHPELTGRENIFLNGAILGMKNADIRKNFDQIVEFAEISRFLDTPVKRYSSGMYMRLAFSVAAHLTPDILVVDEVLAVGDARFQRKCLGKLEDVAKGSGRTVLFVTHNMSAVQALCNRVLVLRSGRLIEDTKEVRTAIGLYADASESRNCWERPDDTHVPDAKMIITAIRSRLVGEQPAHQFQMQIDLRSFAPHPDVFLTFDISDSAMTPVMEACPRFSPFIPCAEDGATYEVELDLPPLVPGVYNVSAWIGSAYNVKYDKVQSAVQFEVLVSPDPERTFPHYSDHGFLVPLSRAERIGGNRSCFVDVTSSAWDAEEVMSDEQPSAP